MKRNPVYLCMLLIAAMFSIAADASMYTINFTGSGLVPTSGSFNYDPVNGFSNFLVYWPQVLGATPFDMTSAANNPIGGGCGSPATAAMAFALLEHSLTGCSPSGTYGWTAYNYGHESAQTLDFTYGPTSTYYAIDIHGAAYCSTCAQSIGNSGSWTISVASTTTSWKGPASGGLWSPSANWMGGTPTASTDVLIDNGNSQHSAVTLDMGAARAHNLTIDSDDSLSFNNGTSLTINGSSISNAGNISLNSAGNSTDLILAGNNTVTLGGGGTVTLGNNIYNRIYSQTNGTLVNQETIRGAGNIGIGQTTINNSGVIDANVSQTLMIQPGVGGVTNTGKLEATSGGTLDLRGAYANTGGIINASGTSSVVELDNAVITGGTLNSSSGGVIESVNSATLNGVTISAGTNYVTPNNTVTVLQGTITNNGTIALNASVNNADLQISGPVTLAGTGTVSLGNSTNNRIYAPNGTDTLTIKQTIQGAGQLGVGMTTIVNQSVIDANILGSKLLVQPNGGGLTNSGGILEATNGGGLQLTGSFNNAGGTIQALNATAPSTVALSNAAITGGTLTTTGKGVIESVNSATLNGVTISAGTNYVTPNNMVTVLQGTITNNGTIALNAGVNNTDIHISGPVTLSGGTLTMSNSINNRIYAPNGSDVLTNKGTIQGAGQLGIGMMGLVNAGTINANQSAGILIQTNGSGLNNTGTLQVAAGDLLHVASGLFTNFSGNTLTGGSYVVAGTLKIDELGNAGGEIVTDAARITLGSTSASFIDAAGKNALSKLATITSAGAFTVSGSGNTYTTAGNLTNNGSLTAGNGSKFDVNGNLTNFAGTTLSGGYYNVYGTLQFNGANIVTNAANITLSGTTSKIVDQTGTNNGLANFATNAATGTFGVAGGRTFTTAGNFTNNGTLNVGAGSKFDVNGNLTNFSGTTLTGGTYNVTGTLQFNGANIVTNAANITLTGTTSNIVDQTGTTNGLANFAANAATGSFTLASSRTFTTVGNFSNAGTMKVSTGTTFTVGSTHSYTQTAGTTRDDGTMAVSSGGAFAFNGGSVFGNGGTFTGNVTSGGTFNIGDALKTAGKLAIAGTYAQTPTGALNIDIGGLTAGTLFDQLNVSGAATLGGTLNLDLINGFTPTVGSTFDIMNFASETTGTTFATVNGTQISSTEHFQVVVNPTNVTLDVVSGPLALSAVSFGSSFLSTAATPEPSTLLLLGSGLAGLAAYLRGSKRS